MIETKLTLKWTSLELFLKILPSVNKKFCSDHKLEECNSVRTCMTSIQHHIVYICSDLYSFGRRIVLFSLVKIAKYYFSEFYFSYFQ